MPNGYVHSLTTIVLAAGAGAVVGSQWGYTAPQTLAVTGGTLAGLLLTPDLDVNGGSISNHHARKLGGWGFGLLWAILWTPYSYAIPHRSVLSHAPLLGTVLRLGYLLLVGWLLLYAFHLLGRFPLPSLPPWGLWAFTGLAGADFLHFILDCTLRN